MEINNRVDTKDTLTIVFSDFISNKRELCAIEAERIIEMIIIFQISSKSRISQIAVVVLKKPITAIIIPKEEKATYLCLSYKAELHNAVKLKPPIVKVVNKIFDSISPKSPIRKRIMPINALKLKEIIIVIKNTFLKLVFSSMTYTNKTLLIKLSRQSRVTILVTTFIIIFVIHYVIKLVVT